MASDAISRARRLNDDAALCEVLDMAGSAYAEYAPIELSLETSVALLEVASARGDRARVQRARARLAFDRARLGDFGAYENEVEAMLRESEVAPSAQARIRPLLMASLAAGNRGRLAESRSLTREAQQLLALIDEPGLSLAFRAHVSARAVMLHLDEELEVFAAEIAGLVKGVPEADGVALTLRAWFYARLGRLEDARRDLASLGTRLAPWLGSFVNVMAESAAATLSIELCRACHEHLLPFAGLEGVGGHVSVSYDGPVDRLLGLLESALGDHAAAEPKLRAALAVAETRGFRTWVAQGHYDLGLVLERAGQAAAARVHFRQAASVAEQCEMSGLVRRAQRLSSDASTAVAAVAASPSEPSESSTLAMTREGELYRLQLGARCAHIRASRGAELLARLVEAPNQEIHVLALASDEGTATSESNAGEALDREALRQYRQRLADLDRLMAAAETDADLGRLPKLQRERAALEQELQRGLGLGGRARQAASTTERARVNVQRRLKDAVERVAEASPELGTWLAKRLRTGTYCSFLLKA
jgi:tetratricopeptide (TPR) repeat protein